MPEIIVKLGDNIVQKYFFFQEPLNVGRAPDNEIIIENLAISRNHACVKFEEGHYYISDLDSSNGTFVNGVKIKKTELMDKDVITIGKHKLYFYDQRTAEVVHQPSMKDSDSTMLVTPDLPEVEAVLIVNKGRQKGQRYTVSPGVITTIGRGGDNDIRLTDWFVSKQHAQIEQRLQRFFLKDLGSWRHTFVNGETIQETPLKNGDVIQLGPTVEMRFELSVEGQVGGGRAPEEVGLEHFEPIIQQTAPRSEAKAKAPRQPEPEAEPAAAASSNGSNGAHDDVETPEVTGRLPIEDLHLDDYQGEETPADPISIPRESEDEQDELGLATFDISVDDFQLPGAAHPSADTQPVESPILTPVAVEEDKAEAVYEQMAESSLLAAAAVAAPTPADTAPLGEKRVDSEAPATNDAAEPSTASVGKDASAPESEIEMWERALQNKSQAIRKQAAKRLKQLTGKDYDY